MVNVVVKKAMVSSMNELMEVSKKNLARNRNIQIFISCKLMKQLLERNRQNIIWEENVSDSVMYSKNVEKAVIFCIKEKSKTTTYQIHYAKENSEYIRISFIGTKGLLYRSYNSKMNEILIICSD